MKVRRFSSIFMAVALLVSLAACGGTSAAGKSGAAAESAGGEQNAKKIDIRITTRWGGEAPAEVYWRDVIQQISSSDMGVNIIDESITNETSYLDKLRTQIATGEQPDIFIEYGGARLKDYVEAGILLDVQPYLDEDPEWRDNFLNLFDKWQYEGIEGTYGLPCQFYSVFLYYNKAILAENGIEPPETFDELKAACEKLVASGKIAFKLGEKDVWRAGHFFNNLILKSYGVQAVTDLGDRTLLYNDPKMVQLYATIKEFNDKGWFGPNAVGVDVNAEVTAFKTAESAFIMNGSWLLTELGESEHYDDFGILAFPTIDPQYASTFQGGSADGYSISKRDDATNEASMKVVKYLTSAEYYQGMEKYCNGGVYPVKFESAQGVQIDRLTTEAKKIIATGTDFRDDVQTYDKASHMLDTVRNALQGLFIGNTPEQCAAEILEKDKANS